MYGNSKCRVIIKSVNRKLNFFVAWNRFLLVLFGYESSDLCILVV